MVKITKRFDILWFGESGPTWMEGVDTLEMARARIQKLPQGHSGSYAVLDQHTGDRLSFAARLQASGIRTTRMGKRSRAGIFSSKR